MAPHLCLEPLSRTLIAVPSWLPPTIATVIVAVPTLVRATVILVALFTGDGKRAKRALKVLEYCWPSRRRRTR